MRLAVWGVVAGGVISRGGEGSGWRAAGEEISRGRVGNGWEAAGGRHLAAIFSFAVAAQRSSELFGGLAGWGSQCHYKARATASFAPLQI